MPLQGSRARQQFVQQHAERIDIAARVHTEVDDLGDGLVVVHRHQDVGRLDVAVDDPLLMRVLNGVTDRQEQLQPLAGSKLVSVTEVGNRDAVDELHDEVGAAALGGAGVEDLGNVLVIHQRQSLALGLEASDHLLAVHARLDDFEGYLAPDWVLLLGHEHQSRAALADLLHELVRAEDRAGSFGNRLVVGRRLTGSRAAHEAARPTVRPASRSSTPRRRAGSQ